MHSKLDIPLHFRAKDLLQAAGPKKLNSYRKQSIAINELKLNWNKKMQDLEKKGYDAKEVLNAKKDSAKIKDLDFLKNLGGPFTKKEDVADYLKKTNFSNKEKNSRLYVEVRYARCTSLSLKETAKVFRLKRGGKKLETEEYASNLMEYLDDSKNMASLTITDLNNVLGSLQGNNEIVLSLTTHV